MTNSKREERRRNFVIKEFLDITKEGKVIEGREAERSRDRHKRVVKRHGKL